MNTFKQLSRDLQVVLGGTALYVIMSFLNWQQYSAGPFSIADLREGDEVAGFKVLDVPGHSAGHVAYWRESDRALICGDVFTNMDTITGIPGLHEPKAFFTPGCALITSTSRVITAVARSVRSDIRIRSFTT